MKRIKEILVPILIGISIVLFMLTFLLSVNKYRGKVGMPYTISTGTITIILIFIVGSILALSIGYILSKKNRLVTFIGIVILILNIYRLSQIMTILDLLDKVSIPYV